LSKNFYDGDKKMNISAEHQIWDSLLQSVEKRLNRQIFDTWFRPIRFEGCDHAERVLHLHSPSKVNFDWVNSHYSEIVRQSLKELDLNGYKVDWTYDETDSEEEGEEMQTAKAQTFDFDDDEEDDDLDFSVAPATTPAPNGTTPNLFSIMESVEADSLKTSAPTFVDIEPLELSLNQKYSFNTFVVGSCNQFAHAAALAIAEAPGKTYNPLYIYGGVGLGKTHLMHAAGHAIKERNRHLRISYTSAEKFMNELINAIRYNKTLDFREKYRSIDVLLIDDIQFMAAKERTQEEFFHTFNALYDKQKQIVITSDCPPREIPTLEERLHSRFEWGLIADIEPPDLETKVAILRRKAEMDGIDLPDDVALFIASKVKNNIRELEGSLVRLVAISSLKGLPISKMLAQDAIRNITDNDKPEGIKIEDIQKTVGLYYKLSVEELKSKNNSRQIAVPRQVAMYLCKRLTKESFPEIGKAFGGKHHTTVMHSFEKIDSLIQDSKDFHRVISELIDSLCK
jgi:chromosomal replication initiator protein